MRHVSLVPVTFLLACGRSPVDSDSAAAAVGEIDTGCTSEPATLELGTGSDTFETLADGQQLTMVHGPQGGWHMLGSGRVTNTRDVVGFLYTIEAVESGVQVSWNQYYVQLASVGDCTGAYPGMYGYLDVAALADGDADTPPEILAGQEMRLDLTVTDPDGRTATDSRTVIAALDPMDE